MMRVTKGRGWGEERSEKWGDTAMRVGFWDRTEQNLSRAGQQKPMFTPICHGGLGGQVENVAARTYFSLFCSLVSHGALGKVAHCNAGQWVHIWLILGFWGVRAAVSAAPSARNLPAGLQKQCPLLSGAHFVPVLQWPLLERDCWSQDLCVWSACE